MRKCIYVCLYIYTYIFSTQQCLNDKMCSKLASLLLNTIFILFFSHTHLPYTGLDRHSLSFSLPLSVSHMHSLTQFENALNTNCCVPYLQQRQPHEISHNFSIILHSLTEVKGVYWFCAIIEGRVFILGTYALEPPSNEANVIHIMVTYNRLGT